jgi:predicted dehydrogenase
MKSRRQFLNELSLLAGSGILLNAFPWFSAFGESNKTIHEKVRLAIIGTGSRGRYLLDFLKNNPKVNIAAICDNYKPSLAEALKMVPNSPVYYDYRRLLDQKDIDCVVIATPLHEHAKIVLDAFAAGKHLFCEKSLAYTENECLEIYNVYKQSRQVMFMGHQRMFDPRYLKMMEMVRSGTIGEIQKINTFWYRNNDWRRPVPSPELERKINWRLYREYSGGLMTELATHQIQVGNWVTGRIPQTIMGSGAITYWKDGREVYDNVSVVYTYPKGVKMTFDSVIANKFYGLEEQILGSGGTMEPEKGCFYYEDLAPASGILQLINDIEKNVFNAIPIAGPTWVPETANKNDGEFLLGKRPENDGSGLMMEAFVEAVIQCKKIPVLIEQGYYASVLALLGLRAMEENRIIEFPANLVISKS